MAYTRPWDETFPQDTQRAADFGAFIRQTKTDLRERITSFGAGPLADRPTPDDEFGNASFGVVYLATDTGQFFRWNGASWVDITPNASVRKYINSVPVSVVNPNTTGIGQSLIIPANDLKIGDYLELEGGFYHSVGNNVTADILVLIGAAAGSGATICSITDIPASLAYASFQASGLVQGPPLNGIIFYTKVAATGAGAQSSPQRNSMALDLSAQWVISEQLAAGAIGNTYVFEILTLKVYRL